MHLDGVHTVGWPITFMVDVLITAEWTCAWVWLASALTFQRNQTKPRAIAPTRLKPSTDADHGKAMKFLLLAPPRQSTEPGVGVPNVEAFTGSTVSVTVVESSGHLNTRSDVAFAVMAQYIVSVAPWTSAKTRSPAGPVVPV